MAAMPWNIEQQDRYQLLSNTLDSNKYWLIHQYLSSLKIYLLFFDQPCHNLLTSPAKRPPKGRIRKLIDEIHLIIKFKLQTSPSCRYPRLCILRSGFRESRSHQVTFLVKPAQTNNTCKVVMGNVIRPKSFLHTFYNFETSIWINIHEA